MGPSYELLMLTQVTYWMLCSQERGESNLAQASLESVRNLSGEEEIEGYSRQQKVLQQWYTCTEPHWVWGTLVGSVLLGRGPEPALRWLNFISWAMRQHGTHPSRRTRWDLSFLTARLESDLEDKAWCWLGNRLEARRLVTGPWCHFWEIED